MTDRPDPVLPGGREWVPRLDRFTLPVLLALAAVLRLVDLQTRGTWEADQGRDMLVLRMLVRDGAVPLVGPSSSIGDVHHGPWYFYLLTPGAALTGGDSPIAVVWLIALAGILAVALVWWMARDMGGPVAGAVAGLTAAVSTAAIQGSTFIWNPNLIALTSSIALAGTWRAWSGGDRRWWLVATVGVALTMQFHLLGVALLPAVAIPYVIDARRRALGWIHLGVLSIFAVAYLPLLVNEVTTDGSEIRAAIDYLVAGGRASEAPAIPVVFAIVGLRVVSWPLAGLITDGFVAALLAGAAVISIAVWRARAGGPDRLAARWLGLSLFWSTAFLTLAAPSLATVVPGLPNDHYHAFADPMVFTLVGLGTAAMARMPAGPGSASVRPVGRLLVAVGLIAVLGWNVTRLPPAVSPDGGVPAGDAAAARVDAVLAAAGVELADVVRLQSLPDFKSTEAMVYPLARLGRLYVADVPKGLAPGSLDVASVAAAGGFDALVLLCDDRFREAIGAACGGPAEATITSEGGGSTWGPLLDRFEAAPERFVSVYGRADLSG